MSTREELAAAIFRGPIEEKENKVKAAISEHYNTYVAKNNKNFEAFKNKFETLMQTVQPASAPSGGASVVYDKMREMLKAVEDEFSAAKESDAKIYNNYREDLNEDIVKIRPEIKAAANLKKIDNILNPAIQELSKRLITMKPVVDAANIVTMNAAKRLNDAFAVFSNNLKRDEEHYNNYKEFCSYEFKKIINKMKEFGTREEEDAGERGAAAVAARAERGAAAVAAQDEEKWQSNCKVVYDAMMAAINSILAKNPQVNLTQPTLDRMDGVTKSAAAVDQVRAEVEAAKIIALDLARGKNREAHRLFGARKLAERMGAPTFLLQIGDRMASWISPAKNPTLRAEQWGELEPGWVEVWPRPGSGETKIIYRWEGSPTGKPETYVRPVAKKSVVPVRKPGGTRRRKSNRKRLTRRNR